LPTSAKTLDETTLVPLTIYHAILHHHPPVSAITDAQAALCDTDLWPMISGRQSRSQYSLINRAFQRGREAQSEKAKILSKPPQNGNLGRKSSLSPYSGILYR
jgi:hypothetical protein